MKLQNLSVKRLFGRVAMGLVLSMSGITIVLFFVTKQTAVLLTAAFQTPASVRKSPQGRTSSGAPPVSSTATCFVTRNRAMVIPDMERTSPIATRPNSRFT